MPAEFRAAFDEVVAFQGYGAGLLPLKAAEADWLVVDHYGINDVLLARIRSDLTAGLGRSGLRFLVADDEGRRQLKAADLILNMRLGAEPSSYRSDAEVLCGEAHALLRSGLMRPAEVANPFPGTLAPVLVMLGGADPLGATVAVLNGLADAASDSVAPVLVHGRGGHNDGAIAGAVERFASAVWLEGLGASELAGWAAICRHAISALGGTVYELGLFQLPFVGVIVADNQRLLADAVAGKWGLPVVDATVGDVQRKVAEAFRRLERRQQNPAFGVDGQGGARVADAMERRLAR